MLNEIVNIIFITLGSFIGVMTAHLMIERKKRKFKDENLEAINKIDSISKHYAEQRQKQIEDAIFSRIKFLEDNAFQDRARIITLEEKINGQDGAIL
jgi:hypothetical protein